MQRIAGMTVTVKADGMPEAIYNGQRDRVVESVRQTMQTQIKRMELEHAEERKRMQAELTAERDRADIQTRRYNGMLKAKLDELAANLNRPSGMFRRVLSVIELVWAYTWAFTIGEVWLEIFETLGLIEKIEDDE